MSINKICMNSIPRLLCALLVAAPISLFAQSQGEVYRPDTSFKVYAGGQEKTIAFGGGFNNAQLSLADVNNDGTKDLVVFEKMGNQVKVYINYGTAGAPDYRYREEYERNFPAIMNYMQLHDYNCDNVPDLFHRGITGFDVYRGYYNASSQLSFTHFKGLWHPNSAGTSMVNAYCDPGDIPGIVDIDADGDLDFLAFSILGFRIQFYRNMRVEDGLPCDSIRVVLADKCWGDIFQDFERTHELNVPCTNRPADEDPATALSGVAKTTLHTGNTLCFFDHEGDGDMDYLNGSISFSDIQFLKNGRVEGSLQEDLIVAQDTTWQSNGHIFNMPNWPSAFWLDYDQDGDRDIVITPHGQNVSENYNCVAWYRNTGSDAAPVFLYQGDTLLSRLTIDQGTGSYPMLYDYDKDGKTDLFVGGDGFFQPNGNLRAKIAYYRNTSTGSDLSFTLMNEDFLNIFAANHRGAYPAVGDLDNDGKDDLVVGHSNGKISFYKDTSAVTGAPEWKLITDTLRDINNNNIDSTQFPAPFIYDIDKDGKKDLILGGSAGRLYCYLNEGNTGELKLQHHSSYLGGVKADPQVYFGAYSAPFIGKLDNTGQDFLLVGSNSGILYRYTGFQNGNISTTYPRIDSGYSLINRSWGPNSGFRSVPAVADLDGDGKYEMVMGNILGGVKIYKQAINVGIEDPGSTAETVKLYPNPAKDVLRIEWNETFSRGADVSVSVYSVTGQYLGGQNFKGSLTGTISLHGFAPGTYFCNIVTAGGRKSVRFIIL